MAATSTHGGNMSNAQVELKLEVVVLPVADVDRAKRFYEGLGWRLDADFTNGSNWRVVQFTPPGSPCSIHFGKGLTTAAPGSAHGTYLIVEAVAAAREDLVSLGAKVSEVFHISPSREMLPGPDPEGRSYRSFSTFSDPDGNTWLLQEIKTRLPGRGLSNLDIASLTDLLRDAEKHHGDYEPTAPKHHWSDWYAAYIVARERGRTADEAVKDAVAHMQELAGAPAHV